MKGCQVHKEKHEVIDKKKRNYIELITKVTKRFLTDSQRDYGTSVHLLSRILDKRDSYTHSHSKNVSHYAIAISERLELSTREKNVVKYSALLHDIGKMGIDMSILKKKGKLTRTEWKQIRVHTRIGAEIVGNIRFLKDLVPTVLHHHERFEGGGYPYPELKSDDIPLTARIVTCADAYDAMTSDRAYRKALPRRQAVTELRACAGSQFDPVVVDVMLEVITEE
jgi:putative nucleotidyltransferase with HDIG domain